MDMLFGNGGDDILIGSTTIHDNNISALDQIMMEWTSDNDYNTRVANLTGAGGLLEAGVAVVDDDDTDLLCGGGGRDLYFADLDCSDGSFDFILFDSPFEDIEEI